MEEKLFPRAAVAAVLKAEFIEARLHTDAQPPNKAILELQKKLTESVATPTYVIVDPNTGAKLRMAAGVIQEAKFLEFLKGARAG